MRGRDGFVLQRAARYYYEDREGDHVMRLSGESMYSGLGHATWGFSFNRIDKYKRWELPHHWEQLTEEDVGRITRNVGDAMVFMGGAFEWA